MLLFFPIILIVFPLELSLQFFHPSGLLHSYMYWTYQFKFYQFSFLFFFLFDNSGFHMTFRHCVSFISSSLCQSFLVFNVLDSLKSTGHFSILKISFSLVSQILTHDQTEVTDLGEDYHRSNVPQLLHYIRKCRVLTWIFPGCINLYHSVKGATARFLLKLLYFLFHNLFITIYNVWSTFKEKRTNLHFLQRELSSNF